MANLLKNEDISWIHDGGTGQEYLAPEYYDKILKPYVFSKSSDLDLFRSFVLRCNLRRDATVLELGPGTGRATRVFFESGRAKRIDFVDLSRRMLNHLRSHTPPNIVADFIRSDASSFLATTLNTYDVVYSLWSLSHSIHQNLASKGERAGGHFATYALRRLFGSVLKPAGRFFFIHFDTSSDEQRISLRQRNRLESWLTPGFPSPSQLIIEQALRESAAEGLIRFSKSHLKGSPIVYSDLDEALETFMNFHMEGVFNRAPEFRTILRELATDLSRYERRDGTIAVQPGCFVYTGERT